MSSKAKCRGLTFHSFCFHITAVNSAFFSRFGDFITEKIHFSNYNEITKGNVRRISYEFF